MNYSLALNIESSMYRRAYRRGNKTLVGERVIVYVSVCVCITWKFE